MHGDGGVRVTRRACTKCSRMIIMGDNSRMEEGEVGEMENEERKREREKKREKVRNSKNT